MTDADPAARSSAFQSTAFKGRVALVTGSSRGIGHAIATRLAQEGADLAIHGRQDEGRSAASGDALVAEIQGRGQRAQRFAADVADKASVGALMDGIGESFGRLDYLVLNAARSPFKPSARLLERDLRQLVETNILGQIFCIQKALPLLRAQGGAIVFISSLGSRFANPSYPLGPMKAAMETWMRDLAEELRPDHIRANAVCGGLVKTDAFKALRRIWPSVAKLPEELFVPPEEIASAVAFLLGPDSAGVNGQTLVVDRGLSNSVLRAE